MPAVSSTPSSTDRRGRTGGPPGSGNLGHRMFDSLSDRLEGIFGRLRSRGRVGDDDVDEALREIRTALLEADVDVRVARTFVDGIRLRLVGQDISKSLSPGQQVIKAVHDPLIA